jgi:hypothetical protein
MPRLGSVGAHKAGSYSRCSHEAGPRNIRVSVRRVGKRHCWVEKAQSRPDPAVLFSVLGGHVDQASGWSNSTTATLQREHAVSSHARTGIYPHELALFAHALLI